MFRAKDCTGEGVGFGRQGHVVFFMLLLDWTTNDRSAVERWFSNSALQKCLLYYACGCCVVTKNHQKTISSQFRIRNHQAVSMVNAAIRSSGPMPILLNKNFVKVCSSLCVLVVPTCYTTCGTALALVRLLGCRYFNFSIYRTLPYVRYIPLS